MRRRDFLKSAALASASTALPVFSGFDFASFLNAKKELYGIQLYSVRDFMEKDPIGTLKKLSSYGYSFVEGFGFADGKWFGLKPLEFKKVLLATMFFSKKIMMRLLKCSSAVI
jgi:hypothetical protein